MAADIVVKAVMLGLLLASIATWTVWIAKTTGLWRSRRRIVADLEALKSSGSLSTSVSRLDRPSGVVALLAGEAIAEANLSKHTSSVPGIEERIASRLEEAEAVIIRSARSGSGLLASVGATAPFIGLFGTVWGIMNSFIGISKSQTTNLAVVAPGIAEALLATAIGLVAAIPAVLLYNQLVRSISAYRAVVRQASAEVQRQISRDLDSGGALGMRSPIKLAAE